MNDFRTDDNFRNVLIIDKLRLRERLQERHHAVTEEDLRLGLKITVTEMDSFPRPKREGETRSEYFAAMLELVNQRCAWEFPEEQSMSHPAGTPSPISAPSANQLKPKPARMPSVIGTSSVTPLKPGWYKKTGGAADGAGENYEWKMLTLVYLRMLSAGHEFQLASNMEEAGLFDDIVLRYRKHSSDPWKVVYLQLKHKQKKRNIPKKDFLGLSGDFSLVRYCESFAKSSHVGQKQKFNEHRVVIIFTTASIIDRIVDEVEPDQILSTGGKVVSFKTGGDVYQELCEWVDFKDALTVLHDQVASMSGEEIESRIKDALEDVVYQKKGVMSQKNELIRSPTLVKLKELLKKLGPVSDRDTYRSFLAKLQVYTNQAHESELDAMIKEELTKVWVCKDSLVGALMLTNLRDKVKVWWQQENVYLTQDSPLWLGVVKSQTENLSKNSIYFFTKSGAEFEEDPVQVLHDKMNEVVRSGGIFNLRVDSRTAASSLKAHQALAKCGNVIHVNIQALLDREEDVFSAWTTRWCRVLVVECDAELEQRHATRIGAKILQAIDRKDVMKSLILIAPQKHRLNSELYHVKNYKSFNDNCEWRDLTEKSQENILASKPVINGSQSTLSLSELLVEDKGFVNKADLEVISELICGNLSYGKNLDEVGKFFVTRRLQESTYGVPFVVNSVSDIERKVVLVVAEPGMGKSTLVRHLAKSAKAEDPSAWVVHIKLNDCAKYLQELDLEHSNEVAAMTFLEHAAMNQVGHCLERLLLSALEQKIFVIIDGVDEVCPYYELQVFNLLGFLKDMKFCQLWVTSRPAFQTKLEETLMVKAYQMVAFSEDDQKEFFNKVWMENVPLATPEKCKEVTENLLTWVTDSLGKDNPILGVPLMAAMIAETFQERMFAVNTTNKEIDRLDVMTLYKSFVKRKFDLYCVEKKKTPSRELAANINDEDTLLKQMYNNHRLAAMRVMFSREEIAGLQFEGKERFYEDLASYLEEVSDGRDKMGILDNVVDGIPHFVHRSFTEYFAAGWLALNFQKNRVFIERIVFDPAYKLLSEMFNRSLSENHPLHVSILNRYVKTTASSLSIQSEPSDVNELDAGGRTPLHLAVLVSATDPHPDCIRIVEFLVQERKARLDVADEVLGWDALRYAERSGAWVALHMMLQNGGNAKKSGFSLIEKLLKRSTLDSNVMLKAARVASVLVVSYLAEERGGRLDCRGPQGETMVHMAAEGGNVEMLEYLLAKGFSIKVRDNQNNTAVRYASSRTLQYLLKCGLDLEATNKQGLTALQDAAQNGEYEKMAALLEVNASYQVSPSDDVPLRHRQLNACLLCAAFAGSLKSVQDLVKGGASISSVDNNGHTAAWIATHRGHIEVMDWLLLRGSKEGSTSLHGACLNGETDIVSVLLSRGKDIEAKGWKDQTPLTAAVLAGYWDVVKKLVEKGANVDCRDANGWTPFIFACSKGDEQVAALLLRHGADINAKSKMGLTALIIAACYNKLNMVKLGLEKGANVDCRDEDGWTPLMYASSQGHEQVAALLLHHGADINAGSNNGRTPLHISINKNKLEVVKLLLDKGAKVDCRDEDGDTPLNLASSKGHEEMAALLLRHGAGINAENNKGLTPLHSATLNNGHEVVKLLLRKGAIIDCRDKEGWTPLMYASSNGQGQAVAMLLRHGADIHAENNKGWTSLHFSSSNNRLNVVKLLLEHGAIVDCRDEDGWTPLNCACSKGHEIVAALLLLQGADVNAKSHKCGTPLHNAANNNKLEAVKVLLVLGARVDYRDEGGDTPLNLASSKGHEQVAALLLRHGAGINARSNNGLTPLHTAAKENKLDVVKLLLEKGADVDCRDSNGDSPLIWAASRGHEQVAALLLRHGDNFNTENNKGWTPLHISALKNKLDVVELLLVTGASVDCCDEDGWTPLKCALFKGHEQVAALLLRHGADIHAVNSKVSTPLHYAASKNKLDVVQQLLEKGATVDCRDEDGDTPLICASSKGHEQVAALLLRNGAFVHATNYKDFSSLHAAASNDQLAVVKLLLDEGAKVDCRDEDGDTPLNCASLFGHEQVAALLLRRGADLHAESNEGWTPLHTAAWSNRLDVVKLLLENGAFVNCREENGCTPLHKAALEGHEHVAALLIRYGADLNAVNYEGRTPLKLATQFGHSSVVGVLTVTDPEK